MPAALTLKQAKAAHKARGNTAINENELRRLQREIQLDRRAFAIKEREKNNKLAAQRRAEKQERDQSAEASKRLGTQRRCDKYGHKSSQFHLGAFFMPAGYQNAQMDGCFDDLDQGLDDASLLAALQNVDTISKSLYEDHYNTVQTPSRPLQDEDIDWEDFLLSTTQIQRDLDNTNSKAQPETIARSSSTSSGSYESIDITTQDMEALDPVKLIASHSYDPKTSAEINRRLMPPPTAASSRTAAVQGPHTEFTNTQLESYLDDNMTLSQI